MIKDIHLDYYRVGADIGTTATYSAHLEGFTALNINKKKAYGYIQKAVKLAKEARTQVYQERKKKNPNGKF